MDNQPAAEVKEAPFNLADQITDLNNHRRYIVGRLIENAKGHDGTFIGALDYLHQKAIEAAEHDGENYADTHRLEAMPAVDEALHAIKGQFGEMVEEQKKARLWPQREGQ